ncbi:MAG: S-layer homology domain-containing protein [Anaerolineae bacterium]|nr:S-layer homology domain-containing protein [Anaerolineae bacterium]
MSTSTLSPSEFTYLVGGRTELWGRSWVPADFANGNFALRITNIVASTDRDFSLDWVAVKVYHLPICYPLTISHSGQGNDPSASPTKSTGCFEGEYVQGENISLTGATADAGWKISGWTGTNNNSSTSGSNTVTMPASEHSTSVVYVPDSPTVTQVFSDTVDGFFKAGDNISVKVQFSKVVNVTGGTPSLCFETSDTNQCVEYASGSGSDTLVFDDYIVQAGDNSLDLEYVNTSALQLNGATIQDVTGNNADLTLPTPGAAGSFSNNNNFVVDTTLPVGSIDTKPSNPTSNTSANFTFSANDNFTTSPNFSFWCLRDSGTWEECDAGSISYTGLSHGEHTFTLDVVDQAGNSLNPNYLTYTWTIGSTFADVPVHAFAWAQIESIYEAGITGGCTVIPLNYCPNNSVTRAQMAVFILRGIYGSGYTPPPATGTVFNDVSASHWAAAWVEQFFAEGITAGCGNGNFCPDQVETTRAQIAVFLLRAKYGSGYTPPPATGTMFADVPLNAFTAAWVEQLATEGITGGCGGGNYCPNGSVTRAQMAVFLQRTFKLPLP